MNKLNRFEHSLEQVFNIMAFIRTAIAIIIFGIMLEQHKYDEEMYRNMETLSGIPHNELQDMWGTMYIETRLNNMENN